MTNSKCYKFFLVILFFTSCETNKIQIDYEIPNLEEYIKAFLLSRKCFEKIPKVFVVNLEVRRNDTLFLEMADSYPDIMEMKFNYDTILFENRVIFTGERIKGYCKKSFSQAFPVDIIEINQNQDLLPYEESNLWEFAFKNGKLIYKSTPCSERK